MKKIIPLVLCMLLTGCGTTKHIVTETQTIYNYVDSIKWHDSTIYTTLPLEAYQIYTNMLDTLKLETSLAAAKAYLDTTNKLLTGSIENKKDSIKSQIKWKEKIVYRHSVVIKEFPVEVIQEVKFLPKSYWIFLGFSILCLVYFGIKIYLKFIK